MNDKKPTLQQVIKFLDELFENSELEGMKNDLEKLILNRENITIPDACDYYVDSLVLIKIALAAAYSNDLSVLLLTFEDDVASFFDRIREYVQTKLVEHFGHDQIPIRIKIQVPIFMFLDVDVEGVDLVISHGIKTTSCSKFSKHVHVHQDVHGYDGTIQN